MMELVDMLGLGSSSFFRIRVQIPFLVNMWTLISGQVISYIFEYLILKLIKNNFSNKNMYLVQIIFGWLFQEHVREDFNMTGGKRFMLKRDFRNRFITQSVKVIRNVIFWIHCITTIELGTWLILLVTLFYLIYLELIVTKKKTEYVFTEHFIFILLLFIITQGCKIYGLFDIFFIFRPFMIAITMFFIIFIILWFNYLFYIVLLKISKTLSLIIRLFVNKINFSLIFFLMVSFLFVASITQENINNENFFHEFALRAVFFNYFFIELS